MVKPHQPEIPEANMPGHHPDHEQDKPSGRDFVAKTHALAQEADYEAPSFENEVLDTSQLAENYEPAPDTAEPATRRPSTNVERAARLVGYPFAVAGFAVKELRRRLA